VFIAGRPCVSLLQQCGRHLRIDAFLILRQTVLAGDGDGNGDEQAVYTEEDTIASGSNIDTTAPKLFNLTILPNPCHSITICGGCLRRGDPIPSIRPDILLS
jgi:hypothetical protein